MNYRHIYHAGNFADLAKHLVLVALLLHLRKKEKGFIVLDTHGGCGAYDLTAEAARRTGEAETGIARLKPLTGADALPEALKTYLDLVAMDGEGHYPGSPLIAARLLRPQDRLVAIEKHPRDARALGVALAPFRNSRAIEADGYQRLTTLLPPAERRGVILIDPPYENADEFVRAAAALTSAWRRFATGIYMLWFPIKSPAAADAFCGEVLAGGPSRVLRIDIEIAATARGGEKERLTAAGLLIVNPPYGLDVQMRDCGGILARHLGAGARLTVVWLAGEPA